MIAMISGILSVCAQNLILWDSVSHFLSKDTLLVRSGPMDNEKELCKYLAVKNNTDQAIPVCVKKVIVDTVTGSKNYICWVRCYSDKIYAPTDTVLLLPHHTDYYHFVGHYRAMDKHGTSTVRYVFYNKLNPNDSTSVRITYSPTNVGIQEQAPAKSLLSASPNPANNEVTFSYSLASGTEGKIVILQLTGTTVAEIPVDGSKGSVTFPASEIRDGLYFYYLVADGKVCSAKKLIIRHNP